MNSEVTKSRSVLYLVECEGWVKVGIAGDVYQRLSDIQAHNPLECLLLAYWRSDNARAEERAIHAKLYTLCARRGEWFDMRKAAAFWTVVRLMARHPMEPRIKQRP